MLCSEGPLGVGRLKDGRGGRTVCFSFLTLVRKGAQKGVIFVLYWYWMTRRLPSRFSGERHGRVLQRRPYSVLYWEGMPQKSTPFRAVLVDNGTEIVIGLSCFPCRTQMVQSGPVQNGLRYGMFSTERSTVRGVVAPSLESGMKSCLYFFLNEHSTTNYS